MNICIRKIGIHMAIFCQFFMLERVICNNKFYPPIPIGTRLGYFRYSKWLYLITLIACYKIRVQYILIRRGGVSSAPFLRSERIPFGLIRMRSIEYPVLIEEGYSVACLQDTLNISISDIYIDIARISYEYSYLLHDYYPNTLDK